MLHVINFSIRTCIFPEAWKCARLTPLHKDGKTIEETNYRPISVLSVLIKIYERLIHDQTYEYVTNANLLNAKQSGFRKRHCTGTCLAEFLNVIYDYIENDSLSGVLLLDLKKAFDTVDHQMALATLSTMNFSRHAINWYSSYLSNRTQLTRVNNVDSEMARVMCGVPQGSILGPLIFILYINSLPDNIPNCNTFLYADDTAIVCDGKSEGKVIDKLSTALLHAQDWLIRHRLTLNLKKMKAMFFGTNNEINTLTSNTINTASEDLERVTKFKYLGIMLDNRLRFN